MIVTLAWRNIWRHRRRTLITLASVAGGLWLAVTSVGLADHTYKQMINSSATLGFGHVTVQPAGYGVSPSLEKRVAGAEALVQQVTAIPGVERAAARISGQGMFQSAAKSTGGVFIAIDPAREDGSINLFIKSLTRGEVFTEPDGRGALVGKLTAEKLGIDLGKKLVLTAIDKDGEVVSELFRVSGIFETGVAEVDGGTLVVPIERARELLRYAPGEATMVSVYVADHRLSAPVRDHLRAQLGDAVGGGAEVLSWRETQPELANMSEIDRAMDTLFLSLLGLLIAAGVLNTSLMSVLERKREFGMMMAVGLKPASLAGMVVVESLFVGLVGLAAGALLCVPWVYFLINVGLDVSGMIGDYNAANVAVDPILRAEIYPLHMLAIAAVMLAMSVAAGLYPAISAARVPPIETLRESA